MISSCNDFTYVDCRLPAASGADSNVFTLEPRPLVDSWSLPISVTTTIVVENIDAKISNLAPRESFSMYFHCLCI